MRGGRKLNLQKRLNSPAVIRVVWTASFIWPILCSFARRESEYRAEVMQAIKCVVVGDGWVTLQSRHWHCVPLKMTLLSYNHSYWVSKSAELPLYTAITASRLLPPAWRARARVYFLLKKMSKQKHNYNSKFKMQGRCLSNNSTLESVNACTIWIALFLRGQYWPYFFTLL